MSKERLEEAKKWIGQMRLILSTKTDKDEIAYVQSKTDLFEWMIEQVEQNNRYRELIDGLYDSGYANKFIKAEIMKALEETE